MERIVTRSHEPSRPVRRSPHLPSPVAPWHLPPPGTSPTSSRRPPPFACAWPGRLCPSPRASAQSAPPLSLPSCSTFLAEPDSRHSLPRRRDALRIKLRRLLLHQFASKLINKVAITSSEGTISSSSAPRTAPSTASFWTPHKDHQAAGGRPFRHQVALLNSSLAQVILTYPLFRKSGKNMKMRTMASSLAMTKEHCVLWEYIIFASEVLGDDSTAGGNKRQAENAITLLIQKMEQYVLTLCSEHSVQLN
ncbi:hypothetical protein BS78_07G065900 [Paspalum vaginatum]|nr:hypothetical protein BS78_07G065900 [Paspalum vaginatum]